MTDYGHAPTAEEAAADMISEGAPLGQPHAAGPQSMWDGAVECAQARLNEAVRDHPLKSLLVAFGLGLLVGGIFNRD